MMASTKSYKPHVLTCLVLDKTVETSKLENKKLCECGCGEELIQNNPRYIKRFIYGHHNYGANKGSNNGQWKGDNVGNNTLHAWVKRHLPIPDSCTICGLEKTLELCNIQPDINTETYDRDLKNWFYACRKCHMISDGRMKFIGHYIRGKGPTGYMSIKKADLRSNSRSLSTKSKSKKEPQEDYVPPPPCPPGSV